MSFSCALSRLTNLFVSGQYDQPHYGSQLAFHNCLLFTLYRVKCHFIDKKPPILCSALYNGTCMYAWQTGCAEFLTCKFRVSKQKILLREWEYCGPKVDKEFWCRNFSRVIVFLSSVCVPFRITIDFHTGTVEFQMHHFALVII